jgi:hypothetical protein
MFFLVQISALWLKQFENGKFVKLRKENENHILSYKIFFSKIVSITLASVLPSTGLKKLG